MYIHQARVGEKTHTHTQPTNQRTRGPPARVAADVEADDLELFKELEDVVLRDGGRKALHARAGHGHGRVDGALVGGLPHDGAVHRGGVDVALGGLCLCVKSCN